MYWCSRRGDAPSTPSLPGTRSPKACSTKSGKRPRMHRWWCQVHWIVFWTMLSCWHANGALLRDHPLDASRSPGRRSLVPILTQARSAHSGASAPGMRRQSRIILQATVPTGGFQAAKYFTYVFFGAFPPKFVHYHLVFCPVYSICRWQLQNRDDTEGSAAFGE